MGLKGKDLAKLLKEIAQEGEAPDAPSTPTPEAESPKKDEEPTPEKTPTDLFRERLQKEYPDLTFKFYKTGKDDIPFVRTNGHLEIPDNMPEEDVLALVKRQDALRLEDRIEKMRTSNKTVPKPVQPETPTATPDITPAESTTPHVQPGIPGMPQANTPTTPDVSPEPKKQPEATAPQKGYSKRFNMLDDFPPIKPAPEPKSALRRVADSVGKYSTDAIKKSEGFVAGRLRTVSDKWEQRKAERAEEKTKLEAEQARQEAEAETHLSPEERALRDARKKYVEALKNKKGSQFDLVNAEAAYEEAKLAYAKTFATPGEGTRKITIDEYQAFKNEEASQLPLKKRNLLKELGYGALSEWSKIPRWRRMAYSSFFLTAGSYAYGSITAGALAGTFATRVTRSVASMLIGQFGGKQYEKIDEEKIEEKKVGLHIIEGRIINTKDISPEVIRDLEKEYKEQLEALSAAQRKALIKKGLIMGILGAGTTSWWNMFEQVFIPEGFQFVTDKIHPHKFGEAIASKYYATNKSIEDLIRKNMSGSGTPEPVPSVKPAPVAPAEDLIKKWNHELSQGKDVLGGEGKPSTFEPAQPASSLRNRLPEPSPNATAESSLPKAPVSVDQLPVGAGEYHTITANGEEILVRKEAGGIYHFTGNDGTEWKVKAIGDHGYESLQKKPGSDLWTKTETSPINPSELHDGSLENKIKLAEGAPSEVAPVAVKPVTPPETAPTPPAEAPKTAGTATSATPKTEGASASAESTPTETPKAPPAEVASTTTASATFDKPDWWNDDYEKESLLRTAKGHEEGLWQPVRRIFASHAENEPTKFVDEYNGLADKYHWKHIDVNALKTTEEAKTAMLNRFTAGRLLEDGHMKVNPDGSVTETRMRAPESGETHIRINKEGRIVIENENLKYQHTKPASSIIEQNANNTETTPEPVAPHPPMASRGSMADAEVPPNEHVPGRRVDYSETTPAQTTPADYHYQGEESYLGNHDDALATQEAHTGSPAQAPAPESAPQTQQPETTSGTRSFRPSAPEATNPALSGEAYINRIPGLRNLADGLHIKTEQMPLFGKIPMGTFLKTIPSYEANAEYYTTKTPFEFVLGQESVIVPPTKEFVSLIETMRELEPPEGYQNLAFEDLLKQKGDAFWNLYAQKLEFLQNTLH